MDQRTPSPLAVITGAGGGLAPAVAHAFARAGYRLALITRPGGEQATAELTNERAKERSTSTAAPGEPSQNPAVRTFGIDLAAPEEAAAGFSHLESEMGQASALLNLAGGFAMGGPHTDGPELLERMLDINLRTAVNATAALLPGMLQQGRGFVASVGAGAVLTPAPRMSAYAAAKGALATYVRSLAAEVGESGVNVALLIPVGAIDTPGNRESMPSANRSNWLKPEALAEALLYLASVEAGGRVHELVMRAH